MTSYLDTDGLKYTIKKIFDHMYPVGSIYISTKNISPALLFGGSWESFGNGRALVGVDQKNTSDSDFGKVEHLVGDKRSKYYLTLGDLWGIASTASGNKQVGLGNPPKGFGNLGGYNPKTAKGMNGSWGAAV